MAPSSHSFFQLLLLLFVFTILESCSESADHGGKLVEKVCKKTSNYSFCIESLYSDSRTQDADQYTLAFISVGLAYANATNTRDLISELLNSGRDDEEYQQALQLCLSNYKKAVSALVNANNDLNSETFFTVDDLANQASGAASDCEAAFQENQWRPMGNRNEDLKGLCEICGIVANLFTGEGDL